MKYEKQKQMAEDARLRRIKMRAKIDKYIKTVERQAGITPNRTTIAAHFGKSEAWLSILLRMKAQDEVKR